MKAIMYHYVRPKDWDFPYLRYLLHGNFKKQLDYFAREFGFVSKADFFASLKDCVLRPGVILTFDDGFKDHYTYVLPELRKRGLWGIFYIPTNPYTNRDFLDVHKIHLLIGKWGAEKIFTAMRSLVREEMMTHSHVEDFKTLTYKPFNDDEYVNTIKRILNYFLGEEYRAGVTNALIKEFLPEAEKLFDDFYLSKQEIVALRDAGMVIGSHSHSHVVMSKLTPEKQKKDIATSFQILEGLAGKLEIRTFCQPYGGFLSFTDDTERILEELGCAFSFNVEPRDIKEKDMRTRRQALPRYDCNHFQFGQCECILPAGRGGGGVHL